MVPTARQPTADGLTDLRDLCHRALNGDLQAARSLARQGAPLIPELVALLLNGSALQPRQRQRLLILMGRLAAHWPDQVMEALAALPWRASPAPIIKDLFRCLEAITGHQLDAVINLALEILSEPEGYPGEVRLPATELLVRHPRLHSAEILWWALVHDPDIKIKLCILRGMETRPLLRAPEAIPALSQLCQDEQLGRRQPALLARIEDLLHRLRGEMVMSKLLDSDTSEMLL